LGSKASALRLASRGVSGNPAGQPRGITARRRLAALLTEALNDQADGHGPELKAVRLVNLLLDRALAGESWAVKEILYRVDGPLKAGQEPPENTQINIVAALSSLPHETLRQVREAMRAPREAAQQSRT
jgi:hypothetical protein